MKKENREELTSLALAIAGGQTVSGWAKAKAVPKRTAYRWSRLPEVRRTVADARRRTIDRAVGILSKHATAAATELAKLAAQAEAEAVRLAACRGLLSDLMAVGNYQQFEERLATVERTVNAKPDGEPPPARAD